MMKKLTMLNKMIIGTIMKQKNFQLMVMLSILVSVTSCKKTSLADQARITVERFIDCAKQNKTDSMRIIYPDCSFYKAINIGQVSVLNVKPWGNQGLYTVICNNSHNNNNGEMINSNIEFTVQTKLHEKQDLQRITDSKGLLQLPTPLMKFLTKTGAIGNNTDKEIADEYPAYWDFIKYSVTTTQLDIDILAEKDYTGEEYNMFLSQYPHANGQIKIKSVE